MCACLSGFFKKHLRMSEFEGKDEKIEGKKRMRERNKGVKRGGRKEERNERGKKMRKKAT